MGNIPISRQDWMDPFLEALANTCNVRASCKAAKISPQTVYRWYEKYKIFRDQWDEAIEQATDLLEWEARQRAMGGRRIDPERTKPSDVLLICLLKAHRPEKFDRRHGIKALELSSDRSCREFGSSQGHEGGGFKTTAWP